MQYLRGWRALRQDPDWLRKIGVAIVLLFVPFVGGIIVTGWTSLMVRRAVSGQDAPLPRLDFDMDYLGKLLMVGFKAFIARMLWSLPVTAVSMAAGCCMYVGLIGSLATMSGSQDGEGVGLALACMALGFAVIFPIVVIVLALPVHVAVMRAELTDDLNSAMRFKDVLSTTKLLAKELVLGQIVLTMIGTAIAIVGICTFYIGLFPGIVVMQIIVSYWLAELYGAYLQKGGEPLHVGPLDVLPPAPPQQP